ncbi:MAG TPA: hypothetical protein DEA91_03430, partial [Paenibacillus sp.]|nr:hypothetical protein [Paenibacillus sp.]
MQIQGTPVRAELETPLLPGETMNLQVGSPGEGGLPVLKPVSLGETALVTPQSMGEALESLGLTDSKAGREIVLAMQAGGVPLTKETAALLDAVMSAKPAGVPASEWLDAAVISVKRGLPVTAESVKGLQQAVFGPQLHQLLSALEDQITIWAGQMANEEPITAESKSGMGTSTGKLEPSVTAGAGSRNNMGVVEGDAIEADPKQLAAKGNGQATTKTAEGTTASGSTALSEGAAEGALKPVEQGAPVKVTLNIASDNETGIGTSKPVVVDEAGEGAQISKGGIVTDSMAGKSTPAMTSGALNRALNAQADSAVNNLIRSSEVEIQGNALNLNKDGALDSAIHADKSRATSMDKSGAMPGGASMSAEETAAGAG